MLEQNNKPINRYVSLCFVTIKIFARTERYLVPDVVLDGFVTIKIFARTELQHGNTINFISFVTIKIFARTEHVHAQVKSG